MNRPTTHEITPRQQMTRMCTAGVLRRGHQGLYEVQEGG
jgi:hypothetical protein